jgi:DivIVA domain-containing protein
VTGQRGAAADPVSIPGPRRPEPERPHFDMVLRGYDRIEVDEYIEKLLQENAALRRELESAPRAEAPVARDEQPTVQAVAPVAPQPGGQYDIDTPAEDSFGFRAEKLLRLAEREAAEMRTRATRDAEAVEATARRRVEEQLRAAEREADQIRDQASQQATRLKKQAAQEAARVSHLHRSAKEELRRLAGLLNAELARPDPEALTPPTGVEQGSEQGSEQGTEQGTAASSSETPASNH